MQACLKGGTAISMADLGRLLVVDDDEDILIAARLLLKPLANKVDTISRPEAIPARLRDGSYDVVLLDMNFSPGADSGEDGLTWIGRIREQQPDAAIVCVTAHGEVEIAVRAMQAGAADFVEKPWVNERLIATLRNAAGLVRTRAEAAELRERNRGLAATLSAGSPGAEIIGQSEPMRRVLEVVRRAAPTDANVLVLGENGTGKELIAREIHRLSARASEAFVSVDLGAVPETLFESELFGHKRGAFTDAKEDRIGRFQAASGGTLFLDEIGNLPLHMQAKLLRALEERMVTPVGGAKASPVDVRVVCATNRPMAELMDAANFRQDLLYRINTVEVTLPPLRERAGDVPALVEHFVAIYARKYNMPRKTLTEGARDRLMAYPWPGNIRSLRHAIERAMILSEGQTLRPEDFSLAPVPAQAEGRAAQGHSPGHSPGYPDLTAHEALASSASPGGDLESIERAAIERALRKHRHNISRAAEELGLTRASLYRRMEKYGL